ncbi:YIP1 family protein [Flavimaricola sp.]|nr:YIP1 family protein [Flavimaricola sp.]MDA9019795.1 YIP1 family protein [Flavimaricola sp.]
MSPELERLWGLVRLTLQSPAEGARAVINLGLSRNDLWLSLALVTVLSVLLMVLSTGTVMVLPLGVDPLYVSPIGYGVIMGSGLVLLVFAIHYTGQALGGKGTFSESLVVVVWLEVMSLALRLVQVLVDLISTGLAAIIALGAAVFLFWCLIRFTDEVHQFNSVGKSILTLVLALVGISVGITIILTFIGVGATQGLSNV